MSETDNEDERRLRRELMMVQIDKGRLDIERVRQEVEQGRLHIDRVRQEMEQARQQMRYEPWRVLVLEVAPPRR